MAKAIPVFVFGVVLGGATTWMVCGGLQTQGGPETASVGALVCDTKELQSVQSRVASLEAELAHVRTTASASHGAHDAMPNEQQPPPAEDARQAHDETTRWRVSAIEKFVPLTDEQKSRLKAKYDAEREAKRNGETPQSESLEQILGTESAAYYRGQVKASFERARSEEIEREVVWLARKLALSEQQERSVRDALAEVERMDEADSHRSGAGSPQDRLRAMIEENRRKSEKRNELLRQILTPDQYQAYVAGEAESVQADVEVFHDPGK